MSVAFLPVLSLSDNHMEVGFLSRLRVCVFKQASPCITARQSIYHQTVSALCRAQRLRQVITARGWQTAPAKIKHPDTPLASRAAATHLSPCPNWPALWPHTRRREMFLQCKRTWGEERLYSVKFLTASGRTQAPKRRHDNCPDAACLHRRAHGCTTPSLTGTCLAATAANLRIAAGQYTRKKQGSFEIDLFWQTKEQVFPSG